MRNDAAASLARAWKDSPFPTTKLSSYFRVYAELFAEYRGRQVTFIETGVLGGGSLFMWRRWLGDGARIIGIDLNPEAKKWESHGFEIYIGDQGDASFWERTLSHCGSFDVLLDDGGHQSFQQIVTLNAALANAKRKCRIVIEDTHASFMSDFSAHGDHSFLNYAKSCSDFLTLRGAPMYPTRIPSVVNEEVTRLLEKVWSIKFYGSIVAFDVDEAICEVPSSMYNLRSLNMPSDFRHRGVSETSCVWPDPFNRSEVVITGT
jgi:hypothetical protein